MTGRIYLCPPGDMPLRDPNPDCPQHERHTPCPTGYVDWHEWAARMHYQRHSQCRCDGCGLLVIWAGGRS